MARSAWDVRVAVGQQESRRSVIKICGVPAHGRVAVRAVAHRKRRSRSGVCWIVRLLPG